MAAHSNPIYSNLIKKNFIQAELAAAVQPKREKGKKESTE